MRTLLLCFALLWSCTVLASRQFVSASSQRIDLNTTLGNWEYTMPRSVVVDIYVTNNASFGIFCKQDTTANVRGWTLRTRAGASTFQIAVDVTSVTATALVNARTTSEFSLNAWHRIVYTYSGSGTVAGCVVRVDGVNQALTTLQDNLSGGTTLNSVAAQIGARGGTGSPAFFFNGYMRRLLVYTNVLSASDIGVVESGTNVPTSNLQLWQEFGPYNDGVTFVADWSGLGNVGFITGATYSTTDPTITALTPILGTSGSLTLAGPWLKTTPQPMLTNLGWAGGANAGVADQIAPGVIRKVGVADYRGWFENTQGYKAIDTANQPGAFDWDNPSIYGTSANGYNFTLVNQGKSTNTSVPINCTNIGGGSSFKAAVHAETSVSTLMWDPDDHLWKAWFHGGNNTGPRMIYLAQSTTDPSTNSWTIQNSGNAVLTNSSGAAWDARDVTDAIVIRRSSSLMQMMYRGFDTNGLTKLGLATSTDKGLTWAKCASNPVLTVGAAGQWDSGGIHPGAFLYDPELKIYCLWYTGFQTAGLFGTGYAYSTDATNWTKSPYNPVMSSKDATAAQNAFEVLLGGTTFGYLDGETYRFMVRADNSVSGTTAFRGRIEGTLARIVKTPYRFFLQ